MYIVDAQVHIWAANTPERPWPAGGSKPHKPVPFSKDDLLREMDVAGVQRVVIVPPSFEGGRSDVALAAACAHPDRYAVMAPLDIDAPASRGLLAGWRLQTGMLGVRVNLRKPHTRTVLTAGRTEWLWKEAEAAEVPVMVLVQHSDMPLIEQIARRYPHLKLVIDHLGVTEGKDDAAFSELDQLLRLAPLPNVAVKATSLPLFTTDTYPYRWLHPYLRRVYDAYGPKRMFWGSDLTRLSCSYRQVVTMFTEEIPWLSNEDKEWIMGRGLCEWIGWKMPGSAH